MNLKLKGFNQLLEDMGAALQSSATQLVNVSVGSVVRALFEANASVVLWLQWLVLQVLQTTRASTSSGPDLDSWMLDFGLARLPPVAASGVATFSRFATNIAASIPSGTLIKTADGSTTFSVVADSTISIWQPLTLSYSLPNGVASADLPIICVTSGSAGNVLAGTVTVISASLPGVDQVTNAVSMSGGTNAETDQDFRTRFQNFLATRSRATLGAVKDAVANVRLGLEVAIQENVGPNGVPQVGTFLIVLDDGTGRPSADLISSVATAVEAVRPIGTTFSVIPPQVLVVNVSLAVTFTTLDAATEVVPVIQNCVSCYLNSLAIGKGASITRVAQQAYQAALGVDNITSVQLNGVADDILVTSLTVIKSGQVVVVTDVG